VWPWLPATFKNQTLDLSLCVIRQFTPMDNKILLNHTISVSLAGFHMCTQQSCEK
jgi:hypothetical protein